MKTDASPFSAIVIRGWLELIFTLILLESLVVYVAPLSNDSGQFSSPTETFALLPGEVLTQD